MLTPYQAQYVPTPESHTLEVSPMAGQDALVPLPPNSFSRIPLSLAGGCVGEEHLRADPSEAATPCHHREHLARALSASGAGGGSCPGSSAGVHHWCTPGSSSSSSISSGSSGSSGTSSRLQYWRAATANSAAQHQSRAPRARPSSSHSSFLPPSVPRLTTSRSLLTPGERNLCLAEAETCRNPDGVACCDEDAANGRTGLRGISASARHAFRCDEDARNGRSLGLLLHNRLTLEADARPRGGDVAMESELLEGPNGKEKDEREEGTRMCNSGTVVPFEEDIKFPLEMETDTETETETENPLSSSVASNRASSSCQRRPSAHQQSTSSLFRTASNSSAQSSNCSPQRRPCCVSSRPYASTHGGSISRAMLPPLSCPPPASAFASGLRTHSARMEEVNIGKCAEFPPSPLKEAEGASPFPFGLPTGSAYGGLRTQSARMGDICLGCLEGPCDRSTSEHQRLRNAYGVPLLERYHSLQDGDVLGKAAERHRTHSFGGPAAYRAAQSPLGGSTFESSPSPVTNNVFEWAAQARMDAKVNLSRRSSV